MMKNNVLDTGKESGSINVFVVGKVGVGKSSLIGAFLGEDLEFSYDMKLNEGHMNMYEKGSICFYDVIGFDEENNSVIINEIKNKIKESPDVKKNAIWYCIHSHSGKYQPNEMEQLKELSSIGVQVCVVMTQCYGGKKRIEDFIEAIKGINSQYGMGEIPMIEVLAQEAELLSDGDVTIKIAAFGLEELISKTIEML